MKHFPSAPVGGTSRRHAALAFVLLCSLAMVCTAGEGNTDSINMHRTGAGAPGPDGWTDAASTNGSFSTRLPCQFNDFTITPGTGDVVKGDVLGCDAGGTRFGATRLRYRDAALAAKYFEAIAASGTWPGATIERTSYRGLPAVTLHLEDDTRCALMRIVRAEEDNIIMTVEAAPPRCDIAKTSGTQFLDSLVLESASINGTAVAVAPVLPECPVDTELSGVQTIAAFAALPQDMQERLDADKCLPATVSSMILRREGVCRIGGSPMTVASLVTLKETGEPVSLMFMAPYSQDAHAALQASLEGRYKRQPLSTYKRSVPGHQKQTTIVTQPGGTMLILGKPSPGMPGAWTSSVQQLAPGNVDLVNRDLNRCR